MENKEYFIKYRYTYYGNSTRYSSKKIKEAKSANEAVGKIIDSIPKLSTFEVIDIKKIMTTRQDIPYLNDIQNIIIKHLTTLYATLLEGLGENKDCQSHGGSEVCHECINDTGYNTAITHARKVIEEAFNK